MVNFHAAMGNVF